MGTFNSSVFKSKTKADGKTHDFFNGPGDTGKHGHVVQSQRPGKPTKYQYARDVEGNVYVEDHRKER